MSSEHVCRSGYECAACGVQRCMVCDVASSLAEVKAAVRYCRACGAKDAEVTVETSTWRQTLRAGDVVEVLIGACRGEHWVVAVYDRRADCAYIAGWPCSMVTRACDAVRLHLAADDVEHQTMVAAVSRMEGDDPRKSALRTVLARGDTP